MYRLLLVRYGSEIRLPQKDQIARQAVGSLLSGLNLANAKVSPRVST